VDDISVKEKARALEVPYAYTHVHFPVPDPKAGNRHSGGPATQVCL